MEDKKHDMSSEGEDTGSNKQQGPRGEEREEATGGDLKRSGGEEEEGRFAKSQLERPRRISGEKFDVQSIVLPTQGRAEGAQEEESGEKKAGRLLKKKKAKEFEMELAHSDHSGEAEVETRDQVPKLGDTSNLRRRDLIKNVQNSFQRSHTSLLPGSRSKGDTKGVTVDSNKVIAESSNLLAGMRADSPPDEPSEIGESGRGEARVEVRNLQRVALTGAGGFLGLHVLSAALEKGLEVRAGISQKMAAQNEKVLAEFSAKHKGKVEFFPFDMMSPEDCGSLLRGTQALIHAASVSRKLKESSVISVIYPEVEGAINLLKAAEAEGVTRVIFVGSLSSIAAGKYRKVFNETHFADPDDCDAFEKAKLFVEKTAWNFVERSQSSPRINLTVFCPGQLVGPLLKDNDTSGSIIFFKKLAEEKLERLLDVWVPVVDARDVAGAIVSSLANIETFNQRFIICEGVYPLEKLYDLAQADRAVQGKPKPPKTSSLFLKFLSIFDSDLRKMMQFYGKSYKFSDEKIKRHLKFKYRNVEESFAEMVYSFEHLSSDLKKN